MSVTHNRLKLLPLIVNEYYINEISKAVEKIIYKIENELCCRKLYNRVNILIFKLYKLTYDEAKILDPEIVQLISINDYNNYN